MPEQSLDTWVWCGHCGASAWGVPPHGGAACPLTLERFEFEKARARETDVAYIAKLNAEREYWERALGNPTSLVDIFKRSLR